MSSATSSTKKPGYVTRVTGRATSGLEQAREAQATATGKDSCCPNLSLQDRIKGCLSCFGLGIVISFLSMLSWWGGQTATFAIFYTFGNIVALCGSAFLMSPKRQFRNMTRARRRLATGIYFLMMLLTLIIACMDGPAPLVLLCVFGRNDGGGDRTSTLPPPLTPRRYRAFASLALLTRDCAHSPSSPPSQSGVHSCGTLRPTSPTVRAPVTTLPCARNDIVASLPCPDQQC